MERAKFEEPLMTLRERTKFEAATDDALDRGKVRRNRG
jgi:hypothetical protein